MDCIFCKIVNGEIPTKIISETNKTLAFMDAFPLTKGHSLVIPKNHYEKNSRYAGGRKRRTI